MNRLSWTFGSALLLVFVPLVASAQALAPDAILPFNGSEASPGFIAPAGVDALPQGPAAIAATRHAVFLADNVNSRVLVMDRDGSPIGAISVDTPIADLRVDSSGSITLLSADHGRIQSLNTAGNSTGEIHLPPSSVRGLAVAPDATIWTVSVSGLGAVAGSAPTGEHAAPLGASSALHGAGLLRGERNGEVLLWHWNQPAELKGRGPARVIPVTTAQRLGLIRPLQVDRDGNVYILLETLSEGSPLEVTLAIQRITPSGRSSQVSWDVHPFAPSSASVAIDEDGTVFRYESRPDGMHFWRIDSHEWAGVSR